MAKNKNENDEVWEKCWVVRCREQIDVTTERIHLIQDAHYTICEKHFDQYWKAVDEWITAARQFGDEDGNPVIGYRTELNNGEYTVFYPYPLPDEILNLRIPSEFKKDARAAKKWRPKGAEEVIYELE